MEEQPKQQVKNDEHGRDLMEAVRKRDAKRETLLIKRDLSKDAKQPDKILDIESTKGHIGHCKDAHSYYREKEHLLRGFFNHISK